MAPEKNSNPTDEQLGDKPPDLPPEILVDVPTNPSHETSADADGRPSLLRIESAGPDSPIDLESVKAQRALRYVDLTLVPEPSLLEDWADFNPTEQRMFRAAVLQKLFDDSYAELENRLTSTDVVAREAGLTRAASLATPHCGVGYATSTRT